MTILSKLTLSDKTKVAMLTSPEAKLRGKMLEALDLQMEAAKATLNGETYIRRAIALGEGPRDRRAGFKAVSPPRGLQDARLLVAPARRFGPRAWRA